MFENGKADLISFKKDEYQKQAKRSVELRMQSWEHLMTLGGLGKDDDLEEQLDPLNFHNSDNCLSNLIVYLYAMDAFLFDELNRASIE